MMYRYFGLYRTTLALLVCFAHFIYDLSAWKLTIDLGMVGVSCFFVLSGFVIAEALNEFYKDRPIDFLKNRFLRIYPPYFFALLTAVVLFFAAVTVHKQGIPFQPDVLHPYAMGNPKTLFWNLIAPFDPRNAYASYAYPIFVRLIWTVVLEIEFYLFMALIMFFKLNPKIAIFIALGWHAIYLFSDNYSEILIIAKFIPYFLTGIFLYHKRNRWALLMSALVVYNYISTTHQPYNIYLSSMLLVSFIALFWWLQNTHFSNAAIRKSDAAIGDVAYSLYLNHYAIGMVFAAFFPKGTTVFLVGTLAAIAYSWVACQLVEPRIKKIRDRIRGASL